MQSLQHAHETQTESPQSSQQIRDASTPGATVRAASHAKNRGRIDVMADLLNCCRSRSNKSHMMLSANVNSVVATRMIMSLTETGLLDSVHEDNGVFYLATPRGVGFIAKYVELQREISPEMVPVESKTNNPNRLNSRNF